MYRSPGPFKLVLTKQRGVQAPQDIVVQLGPYDICVPGFWVGQVALWPEVLRKEVCGHWARGVVRDGVRGRLMWEFLADARVPPLLEAFGVENLQRLPRKEEGVLHQEALECWQKGAPLPAGYHAFSVDLAVNSFLDEALRSGESWLSRARGSDYDRVVQQALFGEVKYEREVPCNSHNDQ